MGLNRAKCISRCCYVAVIVATAAFMFWLAWFVVGLMMEGYDTQRRAVVDYSPTTKPLPSPTTSAPGRFTTQMVEETSANSISRLPTTASLHGSRSEPKRNEASKVTSRVNSTTTFSKDDPTAVRSEKIRPASGEKAPVRISSSNEESGVHARRVPPPGVENRPEEKSADSKPDSHYGISPTKVHDSEAQTTRRSEHNSPDRPRGEARTETRGFPDVDKAVPSRRDDIQSSQRSEPEYVYREPDFDREYPPRRVSSSDRRYDELDEERGTRVKYDKRDRGRDSYDRYSKGDSRVYPDDRDSLPASEDRFRDRGKERYPEDKGERDDDRYETSRPGDRDSTRYRDSIDRPLSKDDRYRSEEQLRPRNDERYRDRDDERYRSRGDERYRDRDDSTYRSRDDERYLSRDDEKYRSRDDERYRSRDDERYRSRDDERYRSRDDERYRDDDRYRSSDDKHRDDRYRVREDDRYKSRDDDRYRSDVVDRSDSSTRYKDDRDRYRPRADDDKYIDSSIPRVRDTISKEPASRISIDLPVGDRKPTSSRYEDDYRSEETVTDYDKPVRHSSRSHESSSRLPRPSYSSEDRYREISRDDEYKIPFRNENDRPEISPTRTRGESSPSRSSLIDSRPKESDDNSRYAKDRIRDEDRYYDQENRNRNTRIQDSRSSASTSESSRRYTDDRDRYQTRVPNERIDDYNPSVRREEVVLDRRSYASEDKEYNRDRRPAENTRLRDRNDENYSPRDPIDDDEYKNRRISAYDRDRNRNRDRYDDEYRRYDDRYDSRDDDRYSSRGDRPPVLPARRYDDDDERPRERDPDLSSSRKDNRRNQGDDLRPVSSVRDREIFQNPDSKPPSRPRYDDDLGSRRDFESPRRSEIVKEPMIGSSMTKVYSREPSDVVVREKRFQSTDNRHQSSRTYGDESSGEKVRPLSAKDVLEAAFRHSDSSDQNSGTVYYPVFDPRLSNLTSPEIIRPGDRRGTTVMARKKRSARS